MSEDNSQPQEEVRFDIDLSKIDQQYATLEGTHQISCTDAKFQKSKPEKGERPMLKATWEAPNPETGEQVTWNDYAMLDTQPGKFRIRQMCIARGINPDRFTAADIPLLIGTEAQAELEIQDSPEFGRQTRIKRLLVDVPKNIRA